MLTDGKGMTLAVVVDGANPNDDKLLAHIPHLSSADQIISLTTSA